VLCRADATRGRKSLIMYRISAGNFDRWSVFLRIRAAVFRASLARFATRLPRFIRFPLRCSPSFSWAFGNSHSSWCSSASSEPSFYSGAFAVRSRAVLCELPDEDPKTTPRTRTTASKNLTVIFSAFRKISPTPSSDSQSFCVACRGRLPVQTSRQSHDRETCPRKRAGCSC
jgi:hypothetical protein